MTDFLTTSTISLGVLLAAYHLLLKREKMHRFNRLYLLAAVAFSLVIPFITLPASVAIMPQVTENANVSVLLHANTTATTAAPQAFNYWPYIVWGIYGLVAFGLAIRFTINIRRFYQVKKQGRTIAYEGVALVILKDEILPHTFLNNIFISEKDYEEQIAAPELLTHELTHIHQRHTLDIIFIELVKTLFWFNPLVYLYKRAIQMNHEFLADENVISKHPDVPAYQHLLLEKAIPSPVYALASTINFNITKKRFIMMTKTTTKTRAALLQFAVLPVIATLMLLSCSTSDIIENKTESAVTTESINATNSKIEVSAVTEDEKKALLVTEPKTFDDPSADYSRITLVHTGKNGKITEKTHSYVKMAAKDEAGQQVKALRVNPLDIDAITVLSVSEREMDSLKTLNPELFSKHPINYYNKIVYTMHDGTTVKEFELNTFKLQ